MIRKTVIALIALGFITSPAYADEIFDCLQESAKFSDVKDYQGAIKVLSDGIAKHPQAVDLYGIRAQQYQKLNKHKEAIGDLNKAILLPSNNFILSGNYLSKALSEAALNRLAEAESDFKESLIWNPTLDIGCLEFGKFLLNQGKRTEANIYLERAHNLFVANGAQKYIEETEKLLKTGKVASDVAEPVDPKALIDAINADIAKHPDDGKLYYSRGVQLFEQKKFDEALKDLNKAIELNPGPRVLAEAYTYRGMIELRLKHYDVSDRDFKKALSYNQPWYLTHLEYGKLFLVHNKQKEAVSYLKMAKKGFATTGPKKYAEETQRLLKAFEHI